MKCQDVWNLLPALIEEGLLDSREAEELHRHLQACPACRDILKDLRESKDILKSLEPVEPPAGFKDRVLDRLGRDREKKSRRWRDLFHPLLAGRPLQALATVLVVVLALTVFRGLEDLKKGGDVSRAPLEEALKDKGPEYSPPPAVKGQAPGPRSLAVTGPLEEAPSRETADKMLSQPPVSFEASSKSHPFREPSRLEDRIRDTGQSAAGEKATVPNGPADGRITLLVPNGPSALRAVQSLLFRSGVSVETITAGERKTTLVLVTDTGRLPKLLESLEKIGTMSTEAPGPGGEGPVRLILQIFESPSP